MCARPTHRSCPIILDTDLGGDIDDTWALAFAALCPTLDLRLIAINQDNTHAKTRLIAKMLATAGRTDLSLATGTRISDRALNHGAWIGDFDLSHYPGVIHAHAAEAMLATIDQHAAQSPDEPLTIVAIGPAHNLEELLLRDPSVTRRSRLIWMAGGMDVGYYGRSEPEPECNIIAALGAARAVLASDWEITLVPIDGCGDIVLDGTDFVAIEQSPAPWCRIIMENYALWAHFGCQPAGVSSILFDTVAVAAAFDEQFFDFEDIRVGINARGVTTRDPHGKPMRCLMHLRDRPGFKELLVQTLTMAVPAAAR